MLILFFKSLNLLLKVFGEILMLIFEILLLRDKYCLLPFSVCHLFLKSALKLLALFALGIELRVGILLFCLQPLGLFFDFALQFFTINLNAIFVPLDSPF